MIIFVFYFFLFFTSCYPRPICLLLPSRCLWYVGYVFLFELASLAMGLDRCVLRLCSNLKLLLTLFFSESVANRNHQATFLSKLKNIKDHHFQETVRIHTPTLPMKYISKFFLQFSNISQLVTCSLFLLQQPLIFLIARSHLIYNFLCIFISCNQVLFLFLLLLLLL